MSHSPHEVLLYAPMQATVTSIEAEPGERVEPEDEVLVLEAMKMEHVLAAQVHGHVLGLLVRVGDLVQEGDVLGSIAPLDVTEDVRTSGPVEVVLDDTVRPDLAEALERHRKTLDAARPDAVAKRHGRGQRTARENLEDLLDPDSFLEYGALAVAAQRGRRSLEELIERSPADGLVGGIGTVNAEVFGADAARCVAISYDYTVFAGTQGLMNHKKQDRLFDIAAKQRLPLVLYAEGGGGRPGDTDFMGVAMLNNHTFTRFASLSGRVPLVGVVEGRCFAGNAALLGCCDVIIATPNLALGMAGPAMIEGGGLGTYSPEEIGPIEVQRRNGVVDIVARDEAHATALAKKYLSYFQGPLVHAPHADQRALRSAIPPERLRAYEVRALMETLFDTDSVLELRRDFGRAVCTALARLDGRAVGVLASDCGHLGGAIDVDAADKAARFMQLCDAHGLPLITLCDTPGFMVGPDVEAQGMVRRAARMFTTGASLEIPVCSVVLRKAYGLGAQAMTAGGMAEPMMTVSWPTGEFGGMGLEGAVRLGWRRELEAIADPEARRARFDALVDQMYERGKALNTASVLEIDAVIDPADTRRWLIGGLSSGGSIERTGRKMIDPW